MAATRKVENRVARTDFRLTRAGQKALADYLAMLEGIIGPLRARPGG